MKKAICLILSLIMIMSFATSFSASIVDVGDMSSTYDEASGDEATKNEATFDTSVPDNYQKSGKCGDNARWYYYEDEKTLIISGTGATETESTKTGAAYSTLPFEKAVVKEGITELDNYAFAYCKSLEEISLPDTLEILNAFMFSGCEKLKSVTVPKNVSFVGTMMFDKCYALEELIVDPENKVFDSRDNCNAIVNTETNCIRVAIRTTTFSKTVTAIGGGSYSGAPGVVEIVMPDTITDIFGDPFMACNELETVVLSPSLKEVGMNDFADCSSLKNVTIPNGIKSISPYAFLRCTSLEKISIPASVKGVYQSAFSGCKALKEVEFKSGVEELGSFAFSDCTSLENVILPASVKVIGPHAFRGCTELKKVSIYNSECEISDYAETIPDDTVIYGFAGSTAEAYAKKYKREFKTLTEPMYSIGDVDLDGYVSIMDATEIQMVIAKKKVYKSAKAEELADVDSDGVVSVLDATEIQMQIAGLI